MLTFLVGKNATAEVKLEFSFIRFQWNELKLPKFYREELELNFCYEVFALIEMCAKHNDMGLARAFKNYQNMIKMILNFTVVLVQEPYIHLQFHIQNLKHFRKQTNKTAKNSVFSLNN